MQVAVSLSELSSETVWNITRNQKLNYITENIHTLSSRVCFSLNNEETVLDQNIESSVEEGTIEATNRDSHNFAINILTLVEICPGPMLNISQNMMISLALGKKLPPRVWQQAL